MMKLIDSLLNRVTIYRLVLYILGGWLVVALGLSAVGLLPYDPFALLFSTGFLIAVCWLMNMLFAKTYHVPPNVESAFITALILALIITPLKSLSDLWFLGWAGVLAMASKYILAINRKHLFNPAAFAVALTALTLSQTASWWVGTGPMLPFVLIGGALLLRRLQRGGMVLAFLGTALFTILFLSLIGGNDLIMALGQTLLASPLFFFGFIILTEPLTTPPTRTLQLTYGVLVGFLFAPQLHLGSLYSTPELAILAGNIFSWLVSQKSRLVLRLRDKNQIAPDVWDFTFVPSRQLAFAPGQYMEWTLGFPDPDSRGNRRYFTLASSPTEDTLRLGVKFYEESSTFKLALLNMGRRSEIVAGQLAGDFTLPEDPRQRCVFIAGGIGITPFRSMIKYLLDTHQRRPIILFYSNKTIHEVVYKDIFDRAQRELGIKTVYTITGLRETPPSGSVRLGRIDSKLIRSEVPNFLDYVFYVSGPSAMVNSTRRMLRRMHVPDSAIKTDDFPGLA